MATAGANVRNHKLATTNLLIRGFWFCTWECFWKFPSSSISQFLFSSRLRNGSTKL